MFVPTVRTFTSCRRTTRTQNTLMLRSATLLVILPLAAGFHAAPSTLPGFGRAAIAPQRPLFASAAARASFSTSPVQPEEHQLAVKPAQTVLRTGLTFSLSLLLPALALAAGAGAGEHLHLGQKVRLQPLAWCLPFRFGG